MPRFQATTGFVALCLFSAIMAGRRLREHEFRDTPELPRVSSDPASLTAFADALDDFSSEVYSLPWAWVLAGGLGVGLVYAFSILAHELGHYLTARGLGAEVEGINLNAAGGFVEIADDASLSRGRFALIVAAGPLVTACIAVGAYLLYRVEIGYSAAGVVADEMVNAALIVNTVALVLNLLPFRGLDGWQLLRTTRAGHNPA